LYDIIAWLAEVKIAPVAADVDTRVRRVRALVRARRSQRSSSCGRPRNPIKIAMLSYARRGSRRQDADGSIASLFVITTHLFGDRSQHLAYRV
jgi:hypothetical protein